MRMRRPPAKRRRPEVRFEQHEPSDDGDHRQCGTTAELEAPETLALLGERGSQVEDDRELGELGGLQGRAGEMEPAARAAARHADPRRSTRTRLATATRRSGRPRAIGFRGGRDATKATTCERDRDEVLAETGARAERLGRRSSSR